MPGGGKGPTSSGNITQTSVNPTQQAQLPFLTGGAEQQGPFGPTNTGWNQAFNLAVGDPMRYYPNQTLADFNPGVSMGYQALANDAIGHNQGLVPTADSALTNAVTGGLGVAHSPAFAGLNNIAGDTSAPQGILHQSENQLSSLAGQAPNNPAGGDLQYTADGKFLGQNPFLAAQFNAAASPVTRAYQTATAPQTDSAFEGAGRYGSGALANARSQNEQNLGTTLGNMGANLYGQDYANERGLMTTAANDLGNQYTAGINSAAGAAAGAGTLAGGDLGQTNTALGSLQTGYQGGNTAALQGLALSPSVNGLALSNDRALTQAGQGFTAMDQAKIQDAMARFYGEQNAPWQTNQQFLNQVGQPTTGSSSVTSPLLGPSMLSQGLSGISGLSALNGLTGGGISSGLSGLLGGGGVPALSAMTGGDAGAALAASGLATDASGGAGLETLASAAPMAWIICTELVRQGRLPRRFWAAGTRVFAAYPEIARNGYHVWAIPSVRHLRRRPNSLYSRALAKAFNWRAENIAAHAGVKGARKLWRGAAVTAALALPCLALGALCKARDWRQVYEPQEIA